MELGTARGSDLGEGILRLFQVGLKWQREGLEIRYLRWAATKLPWGGRCPQSQCFWLLPEGREAHVYQEPELGNGLYSLPCGLSKMLNLLPGNKRSISQARPVCQILHHNKPLGKRSDPVFWWKFPWAGWPLGMDMHKASCSAKTASVPLACWDPFSRIYLWNNCFFKHFSKEKTHKGYLKLMDLTS